MWLSFPPFQSDLNCNAWVIILMKSRFFRMLERSSVFWRRQWVDTRAPLLPAVCVKKSIFFILFREKMKTELWHDHQCAVLSTGHGQQHAKKTQHGRQAWFFSKAGLKIFDLSLIVVITTYSLLNLLNLNIHHHGIYDDLISCLIPCLKCEAAFPADAKEAFQIAVRVPDVPRCACMLLLRCFGVIWAPKSLNRDSEGDLSSTPHSSSVPAAGHTDG